MNRTCSISGEGNKCSNDLAIKLKEVDKLRDVEFSRRTNRPKELKEIV
jgi:hypothetical protein